MNEDKFWQIIESFDWSQEGNNGAVIKPAIEILSQMTEQELRQFDEILADKLYALDTQAHAVVTGFGVEHFSVDSFLYVRCCVVANGRDFYNPVLKNPNQMPKNPEFEPLLYLTSNAAEKMGLDNYRHSTQRSYETFSNIDGWKNAQFPDSLPPGHKPKHQRDD